VQQNPELWAEVIVDGTSMGRSKLGAVPYAVESKTAAECLPNNKAAKLEVAGDASLRIHSQTAAPTAGSKMLILSKGTTSTTDLFSVDNEGNTSVNGNLRIGNDGAGTGTSSESLSLMGTAGLYNATSGGASSAAAGVYFVSAALTNSTYKEILRHTFSTIGTLQIKVDLLVSQGNNYEGSSLGQPSGATTLTFQDKSSTATLSVGSTDCTFKWTQISGNKYVLEGKITGSLGTAALLVGLAIVKGGEGS